MKKLLFVIPLTLLMLMVAVTATMPTVKAQDEEEEGEGECQYMDASEIGEGWQRRVCSNSDYDSWISPSGEECFANPVAGTTRCGEVTDDPPVILSSP